MTLPFWCRDPSLLSLCAEEEFIKGSSIMIKTTLRSKPLAKIAQNALVALCSFLLLQIDLPVAAHTQQKPDSPAPKASTVNAPPEQQEAVVKMSPDQLDSLVAPIALYPDPMLAQVLAASTYPLELVQLQQWLAKNKNLKDKALVDAVQKQPWDPSVQSMAALPDVVKRLADDVQWTTDLGNAFLAQQSDVMDAVQRMRKKAQDSGNLKSNEQQKVETKVVESKQVVVIEQANPQVVYVPTYNPTVVYGPPVYPYPPIYYPPPGYYAAGMAISFGIGVAMGAAWGGGWGYGCGWGGNNNVTINNNNNFNRNSNINGGNRNNVNGGNRVNPNGNRGGGAGGNSWQHNPQHRGGTPYSDRSTANKYGGTTRGASASDRQANARQNISNRGQGNRDGVGDNRGGVGDNRGDRGGLGDNRGDRGGDRAGGGGDRGGNRGGGDRVGNRSTSGSGGSRGMSGGGMNGSSARASSSRGASSMGSRGGSRGGGGSRRR
jgi:hypothetical protein